MSEFEKTLNELIERTNSINPPVRALPLSKHTDPNVYNEPANIWMNDVEIFYKAYLQEHALATKIKNALFFRDQHPYESYNQLISYLKSIGADKKFIEEVNNVAPQKQEFSIINPNKHDVFLSHATSDKEDFVEELYESLDKLGISIFYDSKSIEWGDNWKEKILQGIDDAEFAIIVISKNFFGREWTEKELVEFLGRQNRDGQKIILPILHNITIEDLQQKYPKIADIQVIDSRNYNCDEIALLFAKQLIKRLKNL